MALALNNLKRIDMPLNKETKPIKLNVAGNTITNIKLVSLIFSYIEFYLIPIWL